MASRYWSPDEPAGALDDPAELTDHFDPLSRDLTRGRYTRVAGAMARGCPVAHTDRFADGLWTVSGYDQLVAVHREEGEVYSNVPVLLQSFGQVRPMIPMESDPPLHRQYKQIIAAPLSRREQQAREPYYRDLVRRQIATFLDDGVAELFEQLCTPVTVHALMDTLGVPAPDRERLADLAVALVRGQAEDGAPAVAIYEYFSGLAAAKRTDPGDDIVSLLCRAEVDGRPLSETEILDYCLILLPAGFETTASSMSFMFLMLAEDPELQALLRAEPERIPTALEELMRYVTPTRSHTRTVLTDTDLDGHTLRAGERVYLNWAGANHDPAVFDHPDELRIDRSPNRHMAYGYGAHTCVGLHMARTELKVAFEEVLAALDDIRITSPDDVHETIGTTWAITHLPVTFTRGGSAR
ncbi:cytochrome P450 [Actinomycetospora corticicola]|uniref:Cytochrome P450 n=1 Tax=Actinomycetospora corticicola TaxID=663602 RepID=A0A7Y9DSE1_9PSEU|nr:cytochrome P450 [Actinomycetospora corticicola]NYD34514.1 cytochrome P450 [Actinomycetospora corticicola]